MARRPYPNGITEEVRAALDAFTDDEIQALSAYYDDNGFICLGYLGSGGMVTQWAEPEKAAALVIIERAYEDELLLGKVIRHERVFPGINIEWNIKS